jgi:hypothetical protein
MIQNLSFLDGSGGLNRPFHKGSSGLNSLNGIRFVESELF